jgi:hypothetical protein
LRNNFGELDPLLNEFITDCEPEYKLIGHHIRNIIYGNTSNEFMARTENLRNVRNNENQSKVKCDPVGVRNDNSDAGNFTGQIARDQPIGGLDERVELMASFFKGKFATGLIGEFYKGSGDEMPFFSGNFRFLELRIDRFQSFYFKTNFLFQNEMFAKS